ncbi:MAG: NAD(P)-dependent oxidoreductase [Minisyncoccia bacterium]
MTQNKVLITGGAGFIGAHLAEYLLEKTTDDIVLFDQLEAPPKTYGDRVVYYKGNIFSPEDVTEVFETYGPFATVYHLAAAMPNKEFPDEVLWKSNVDGTDLVAAQAVKHGARSFVFTSSNVLYGIPESLPTVEDKTPPRPLEIYGRSKVEAEKLLATYEGKMDIQIFRCPVVSGIGRLGLQAILFEFISEDKNVYVLGDGSNKYQFADVLDVCSALEKASHAKGFDVYNIGSDEVMTLREIYQKVIEFAGSRSKIVSIPKAPALFLLSILDKLNLSPLGVYQYTMLGLSLYADTTKIKSKLAWQPETTDLDTFIGNYKWFIANKGKFAQVGTEKASANRSLPRLGVLKLLKLFS